MSKSDLEERFKNIEKKLKKLEKRINEVDGVAETAYLMHDTELTRRIKKLKEDEKKGSDKPE